MVQGSCNSNDPQYSIKGTLKVGKTMPCQFFNHNSCSHTSTHATRGVLYKHIYVLIALHQEKGLFHIVKWIAGRRKKVN